MHDWNAVHESAGRLVAGRYRVRSLIGRGGMGRVWLADEEVLDRQVAVKQILPGASGVVYGTLVWWWRPFPDPLPPLVWFAIVVGWARCGSRSHGR